MATTPAPTAQPATPTPATTPAPTRQPKYTDAAPNGTTVADLARSWAGDSVLPAYNQPAATVWHVKLRVDACAVGDECGEFHIATDKAAWSGNAESCDYAITYLGYAPETASFVFSQRVTGQSGHKCYTMLLHLMLLPGRDALAVQEIFNAEAEDAGILRPVPSP